MRIATAGIAVGICVMVISVAVVFGFKHTIQDKVVGFGSHITVGNFLSMHGFGQMPVVMGDSMRTAISRIEGVKSVSPFVTAQGILKTDDDFLGVQVKGVGESFDADFLKANLVEGSLPGFMAVGGRKVGEESDKTEILLSKTQADRLSLKVGDRVFAYFIKGEDVKTRRFSVTGIFQTSLTAFDESLCFTDFRTVRVLNGYAEDEADGAEVLLNNYDEMDVVADRFVEKINRTYDRNGETYTSQTVKDMYPGIFSWLDLLDLNVWIILVLMVAVAGFTMISGLLIIILERTTFIGLMKALGLRDRPLRKTFIWLAMFIVCKGLLMGNILAFALMFVQKFTGIIKLDPEVYYVAEVPLEINLPIILLINICTMAVCSLILTLPSLLVTRISPAKVMRYE